MYLNVNLTPPAGGSAEGSSCVNTPKTPEILNSLISLTTTPISSYSNFPTTQGSSSDLLSPTSSTASPNEERSFQQICTPTSSCGGSQMSPNGGSDPGGGHSGTYVFARVSGVFKGVPTTPGTPSPPVPELKSPVNTVEATKSALIKEGLKIQIKSKLLSAGVEPNEILSETKYVKEEVSDSQEESETVEDQNHRLKTEIQRLTNEKLKLEKLLEDPSHVASCRHSCSRGTHNPLVITFPDAPEQLLPSSSSEGIQTSTVITDSTGSEVVSSMPYCSPSAIPSWDSSFSSSDSLSPSYVNLSPSTISPLSLPNVSPPHLVTSSHNIPPHTSPHSVNTYLPPAGSCSPYTTDAGSFVNLSPPTDITVTPSSLSLPTSEPQSDHNHESLGTSTSTTYLNIKAPKMQTNKRPQPYTIPRSSRIQTYQTDGSVGSYSQDLLGCRLFGYTNLTSDNDISSHDPFLHPNSSNEYLPNTSPPYKVGYNISPGKQIATNNRNRYNPYDRQNRHSQQQMHQSQLQQQQHSQQLSQSSQPQQHQIKSNPFNFGKESLTDLTKPENTVNVSKEEHFLNISCSAFKPDVNPSTFYSTCMYDKI
ncbi:hypothetical protein Avbf_01237 [Armadillidium vulgare]|nr:hypothetical protein Avbf_01237 [Armadillidium vulgare]